MRRIAISVAAAAIFAAAGAAAQTFPSKTITIVVPSAPGGPNDMLGRILAQKLEGRVGQSVVVENRPGGGTYTGGEYVLRAAPDGHTLLVNAFGGLHPHLFVKGLPSKLSHELIPVAPLSDVPYLVFGPTSIPPKDLKEFVAYAKANPKKLNAAVFAGTANSLELRGFLKANNIEVEPITYSNTAAIMTSMLQGDVHIYNGGISGPRQFMNEGKIRGYAVTSDKRDPGVPDVPSTKELGFDWISSVYYVVLAPPKTPDAVVNFLNEKINAVMADPEVVERLTKAGSPAATAATPKQMMDRLKRETAELEKAAKDAGVEPK
jgi:tripartite-type tricarboxylate transporter receptor subunit TctC